MLQTTGQLEADFPTTQHQNFETKIHRGLLGYCELARDRQRKRSESGSDARAGARSGARAKAVARAAAGVLEIRSVSRGKSGSDIVCRRVIVSGSVSRSIIASGSVSRSVSVSGIVRGSRRQRDQQRLLQQQR